MRISLYLVAVALAVAACGEVKGVPLDGKKVDAAIDAVDADMTGMATVVTQSHGPGAVAIGLPVGDVDYVTLLPNGMLHDMGKTDTSGHASVKVYPGGTVNVIYRHTADAGADLVTYFGVKPGDTLTTGKYWVDYNNSTSLGTMTMSWSAYSGATSYDVFIPCGGYGIGNTTSYSSFQEYAYCNQAPMGVIGIAFNAGGITAMSYSVFNFSSGGSQALNGWQAASTAMGSFTGLPPEITQVSLNYYAIANGGTGLNPFGYGVGATPTGGAATLTFPWVNTGQRTESAAYLYRTGNFYQQRILDAINQPNVTIANPTLAPWEQGGILTSSGDRKIEWLQYGTANQNGNVAIMSWTHLISGTNVPFSWTFITPPDQTSIDLPKLPAIFDDTQPHPEDYMNVQGFGALLIPSVTGYDGFRAVPEAQLTCPDCAVRAGQIPHMITSGPFPQQPF